MAARKVALGPSCGDAPFLGVLAITLRRTRFMSANPRLGNPGSGGIFESLGIAGHRMSRPAP